MVTLLYETKYKFMKQLLLILLLGVTIYSSYAQQDIFREDPITSPEIHQDHTVTFRIKAPNAEAVSVSGSLDGLIHGWFSYH